MSKIYEALLRAELDRVALQEGRDSKLQQKDSLEGAFQISSEAKAEVVAATPAYTEPDQLVSPFDGGTSVFGQIKKSVWKPRMESLPSLMQRGASVEQFRSLRSHLYELRAAKTLKSVLVSSGLPQEGKSFVAANLALSLALHKNSKVLLIDGDMRRPTLNNILGCALEPGLSDYLSGESRLLDVMQQPMVAADSDEKLDQRLEALTFMSGGNGADRASDLSSNKRFDELIATVSPYFDWIIVDSSPINLVSDAANLGRACDGVLLVARAANTQLATAKKAVAEFKAANLLGFVLNAAAAPPKGNGYYGYYGEDTVKA